MILLFPAKIFEFKSDFLSETKIFLSCLIGVFIFRGLLSFFEFLPLIILFLDIIILFGFTCFN